ncbi:unnamed protein product [Withania somnifera]
MFTINIISSCEGKVQLPKNVVVKAVFAFGDSIVDQGNNNYIQTIAKCNFLPYGKDFNGGVPTGRFCNGKTPPDLIGIVQVRRKKVGIFGIPPIGCLPSQRTLAGGLDRGCVKEYNEAAQLANTKFSISIDSLSKKLAQSKLVFVDIYNPLLDLIVNPQKFGFEEVEKGCCGTGKIEVTILCNKFSGTCEDDTKYLFWDSYHPTEKGYRILVDQILKKYVYRFL